MFSDRTGWKLAPNLLTETHREMLASGAEILDLTVSNPTRAGFNYDIGAIQSALSSADILDYDPQPKGLLSAREAVAKYYRDRHDGVAIDPESLLLTTSTSEGYSYIFRLLCNAGDEILVPKPSYPLFEFLADLQDVKLVPYPLLYDHGWQIDFLSLRKALTSRTRGIVLVHPNNPTGSFVSAAERDELNTICAERGLALVVDEVFLDYVLESDAASQTFAANRDALTFTLSGVSKISGLPQMKLAWMAASGPQAPLDAALARLEIVADTYLSMNAPIQHAAAALLDLRKDVQPALLERVRGNLQTLDRELERQKACQRLKVEGGWYAVLRVPATQSDEDLAVELLRKTSVLIHPGHFYDFSNDGYLVLSLITPAKVFQEAAARMLAHLSKS